MAEKSDEQRLTPSMRERVEANIKEANAQRPNRQLRLVGKIIRKVKVVLPS